MLFALIFSSYFLIKPNSSTEENVYFSYFSDSNNFFINHTNKLNSKTIALNNSGDINIGIEDAYSINYYLTNGEIEKEMKRKIERSIVYNTVLNKNSTFKYTIKKGDSLEKIAKRFGVSLQELKEINDLKNDKIIAGRKILIPGSVKITGKIANVNTPPATYSQKRTQASYVNALTEAGEILIPTDGLNQKKIHSNNGVDISGPCGTPVYAAADGIVVEAKQGGYNGGYGNYVLVQHDRFETLYGHLGNIYVNVGDYVNKGELIATVGNTGFTLGATGCHLHFETRGLKNPLAK